MLVSCNEPSSSSSAAKPKTKIQKIEDVGKARQALKLATEDEANKQEAYLTAKKAYEDQSGALVWRLLRRIVLLGKTNSQLKDDVDKAKKAWEDAKTAVQKAKERVEAAIEALKQSADGNAQAEKFVRDLGTFMDAVKDMRQAQNLTDLQTRKKALDDIVKAQQKALDNIKKAEQEAIERIKKAGKETLDKLKGKEISKQQILTSMGLDDAVVLYRLAENKYGEGPWQKITATGNAPLLPPLKKNEYRRHGVGIHSYSWMKDYLLVSASDKTGDEVFIRSKSGKSFSPLAGLDIGYHSGPDSGLVYAGGYAYKWVSSDSEKELKRFQPGANPKVESVLTKYGNSSDTYNFTFVADNVGNVLLYKRYSGPNLTYKLYRNGNPTTPKIEINSTTKELGVGRDQYPGSSFGPTPPLSFTNGRDGKIYLLVNTHKSESELGEDGYPVYKATITSQIYALDDDTFKPEGQPSVTNNSSPNYSSSRSSFTHLGGSKFGLDLAPDNNYGGPNNKSPKLYDISDKKGCGYYWLAGGASI